MFLVEMAGGRTEISNCPPNYCVWNVIEQAEENSGQPFHPTLDFTCATQNIVGDIRDDPSNVPMSIILPNLY